MLLLCNTEDSDSCIQQAGQGARMVQYLRPPLPLSQHSCSVGGFGRYQSLLEQQMELCVDL